MRIFILLFLLYTVIVSNSLSADESDETLLLEDKHGNNIQSDSLDLTVAPDIISESNQQQYAVEKENNQLLPNIFKDQQSSDISMKGKIMTESDVSKESRKYMETESTDYRAIDGAGFSIKVKTAK